MKEKELKKLKKSLILGVVCVVMFVCAAIIYTVSSVVINYNIIKAEELEVNQIDSQLDNKTILRFNELMIIDEYASYTESDYGIFNKSEKRYYLAIFTDANGDACYASIAVDTKNDIYNQFSEYADDENQLVGDLVLPVCAVKGSVDNSDLRTYYQDCIDIYDKQLSEYFGGYIGSTEQYAITDSKLKLDYAVDTVNNIDAYKSSQISGYLMVYAILAFCIIVFIVLVISVVKKMKKINNTPDSEYELNSAVTQQYTAPEQSTQTSEYYDPQQSQYFNSDNK